MNMAVFKASVKVSVNKKWLTILNNSLKMQLQTVFKNGVEIGQAGTLMVSIQRPPF